MDSPRKLSLPFILALLLHLALIGFFVFGHLFKTETSDLPPAPEIIHATIFDTAKMQAQAEKKRQAIEAAARAKAKAEADELARIEAEQARVIAEEQAKIEAERAKIAAQEQAKADALAAEQAKLDAIQAQAQAAEQAKAALAFFSKSIGLAIGTSPNFVIKSANSPACSNSSLANFSNISLTSS